MHERDRPIEVSGEGLFKERFLVSERFIEACRLDAHGGGQVIQGSTFKSLLPEDMHGAIQSLFGIEAARASCGLARFVNHVFQCTSYLVITKLRCSFASLSTIDVCGRSSVQERGTCHRNLRKRLQ